MRKNLEIAKLIQLELDSNVSITNICAICRLYREQLLQEILDEGQTTIYGIGKIHAVKHKKRIVFGRKIKAHLVLRLTPSTNLKKAINEIHYVDKV